MVRTLASAMVVCLLAPLPAASAGFTYTASNRYITAFATSEGVSNSQTITAPAFAPFNQTVNMEVHGPQFGNGGYGSASQTSQLNPLGISAGGSWSGRRDSQLGSPSGGGTSHFSANFTLDEAAEFTLEASGAMTQFGFGTTDGLPGGFLFMTPGNYHGTMRAGTYQLVGEASGSAGFPPSGNGFSMTLTIPSPGSAAALLGLAAGLPLVRSRRRG